MKNTAHIAPLALLLICGGLACTTTGGYTVKVGRNVDATTHEGYVHSQVFSAAMESLRELGVVLRSSRDKAIIIGQIPPFKVKALLHKDTSWIRIEGMGLDRGRWRRDSSKREWVLSLDGKVFHRKGVVTQVDAVKAWSASISRLLPPHQG